MPKMSSSGQITKTIAVASFTQPRKYNYNWDANVHKDILQVKCKDTVGYFHKSKFGSGGRGNCMKVGQRWMTPNEFEQLAGRASSKDWKRSVRFQKHPLGHLIEDGLLR